MSSAVSAIGGKRKVATYLIDPGFQLKYTGLLVGVVLAVTMALGYVIWRTSNSASDSSRYASAQAEKALKEASTSSKLLRLTAATYSDVDPELAKTIDRDQEQLEKEFEANRAEVARRTEHVELQRKRILWLLIGGSAGLLVLLTVLGIYITHRIVGPVFRLKRLLRQVGTARFDVNAGVRRGDELDDLFETFVQMTYSLKALQSGRRATLQATIEKARAAKTAPEVMAGLEALNAQLNLGLGGVDSFRPAPAPGSGK
jgi:nitrogen fixation/metabolism regulation signal transduction histidine kinase